MHRIRMAALAAAVFVALVVTASPGSAQRPPSPGGDRRAATVRYWTPERVRAAVPREKIAEHRPEHATPMAKGGGKPGGSGGAVTGASWTKGGLVQATTGKVLFTLAGSDYVCSGSVVDNGQAGGRALVLTAGHCVHDGDGRTWATNWMFVPDFQHSSHDFACAATLYGCWVADGLVTTGAWAASGDFDYDVAFAVVGPGGKTATATDDLDAVVGTQDIGFNLVNRASLPVMHSFGYPHASPYDGTVLTYCKGQAKLDRYSTALGLGCSMTGGSSGGPWYAGFDEATGTGMTSSLNSFKYYSDRKTMYGPYFGHYAQATYQAADAFAGTGTATVPAPATLP